MQRQIHLLAVILAAFFCILLIFPKEAQARFMDEKSISTDLSVHLGTLSMTLENQTPSQTFEKSGDELTQTIHVKNTGTLDGKLTYTFISAKLGDQDVSGTQIEQFIEIKYPKQKDFISPQEKKEIQFVAKQNKQWNSNESLSVNIQVTLSQNTIDSDTIGFVDSKIMQFSLKNTIQKETEANWPNEDKFDNNVYLQQNLFYSLVNNKLTTVVPGVIYFAYPSTDALSENTIKSVAKELKDNAGAVYNSEITYIKNKGFKATIYVNEHKSGHPTPVKPFGANIHFGLPAYYFNYGSNEFAAPIIFDFEIENNNFNKVTTTLNGITLYLASLKVENTFGTKYAINIKDYLQTTYDLTIIGKDADYFTVVYTGETGWTLKQKGPEGDKEATLILRNKDTQEIVFSRDIFSSKETVKKNMKRANTNQSQTSESISNSQSDEISSSNDFSSETKTSTTDSSQVGETETASSRISIVESAESNTSIEEQTTDSSTEPTTNQTEPSKEPE